jgi:hypothetical protein
VKSKFETAYETKMKTIASQPKKVYVTNSHRKVYPSISLFHS